ncbi:MAG TPA: DUF3047 domain-containing protein [Candidatus Ozemobacteraceae bacterium]|nr:DUF3047 domain-containing protein [Candidatus Ozemobacteraceae bacterium]
MKRALFVGLFLVTLLSPVFAQDTMMITDFAKRFSDWKVKAFKGKANFQVKQSPKDMITLTTEGSSFMLAKEFRHFKMDDYPFINFEWMVEKLPKGADLRSKATDDQAAGLYVTLPSFPEFINFKAIGYVWETSAPPGVYNSKGFGNIKYVVLKSQEKDLLGQWHAEKRNFAEDFQKLWGVRPGKRKVVISLAADSDNTRTSSAASFGNVFFSRN